MNQSTSFIKETKEVNKDMNKLNIFRFKLAPIDKERNRITEIKDLKVTKDAKIFPVASHVMNFDGCSKGNPGFAGIGAVIYNEGDEVWASSKFIGLKTNNYSEYSALIFGLKAALEMRIENLCVLGDSLLVINQINGIYKVKSEELLPLYEEALHLKKQFKFIEFNHVYREKNKRADELSNIALLQINDANCSVPAATNFMVTCVKGTEPFTPEPNTWIKETDDWLEEEKLEEIIIKRPSKRLAKLTATKIDSFFPKLTRI
jgi:ribonuclease HI